MPKLRIDWTVSEPPVDAKHWYVWKSLQESPFGEHTQAMTRGILDEAFVQNLPRTTGWDLSEIDDQEAFVDAAKIYKRGVPIRYGDRTESTSKKSGSYHIEFFDECDTLIRRLEAMDETGFIIDQNVLNHWPELADLNPQLSFDSTEENKCLDAVDRLHDEEILFRTKRWVVIGGGIACDTAGFAAALAERDIYFVPTTLLAMADACVGGKTGVNYAPYGKNQIGRFYFPKDVFVCKEWLKTLADREFRGGLAECIKHAVLAGDSELLSQLSNVRRPEDLSDAQLRSVIDLKAKVVSRDPTEKGERAILNLGHTLAHALEAYSQDKNKIDPIQHGEAVALGLLFALLLSEDVAKLSRVTAKLIVSALQTAKCIVSRADLESYLRTSDLRSETVWNELFEHMKRDKKSSDQSSVSMVLLSEMGHVLQTKPGQFVVEVPEITLKKAWNTCLGML